MRTTLISLTVALLTTACASIPNIEPLPCGSVEQKITREMGYYDVKERRSEPDGNEYWFWYDNYNMVVIMKYPNPIDDVGPHETSANYCTVTTIRDLNRK